MTRKIELPFGGFSSEGQFFREKFGREITRVGKELQRGIIKEEEKGQNTFGQ